MSDQFQLSAYDYHLPPEQIAQQPAEKRDQSRLLVLDVEADSLNHRRFTNIIDYLQTGDLLVINNTRVFPARLLGRKETGGKVEMLLLEYPQAVKADTTISGWSYARAPVLLKSSKRPKQESLLLFGEDLQAKIGKIRENGKVEVTLRYRLSKKNTLDDVLTRYGQMPLPPYINRPQGSTDEDRHRYQTRYARHTGSVAAPTAGLHFSDNLLHSIEEKGIEKATVTLHVGYGTFAPVRTDDIREHCIHREFVQVPGETAKKINQTKAKGGRIWAVGTTTVRTLEFAADERGVVQPIEEPCGLFIYPGYRFHIVDNLITNFHLPRSSLLFLVSALAGRKRILESYRQAVDRGYRFFSYGDAMAIITRQVKRATSRG